MAELEIHHKEGSANDPAAAQIWEKPASAMRPVTISETACRKSAGAQFFPLLGIHAGLA